MWKSGRKVSKQTAELEEQLKMVRENLQTTVEELEATNEELKSANEELQSNNEELQSTNEELDTSREELQSLNEELSTTNADLRDKNDLLIKANDDLRNFLDRTDIAIIFLDEDLKIRSFTPASCELYKLKNIDIGRPLEDINSNLAYDGVILDAREVLRTLQHKKLEVQSKDKRWYTMRILPYRTVHNAISGLVLSFLDIDQQKRAVDDLADVNDMLQEALEEQKKSEAEKARLLKESTESLDEIQTLLDNAPVAIWIARDPGCLTITGNVYANRLFGVQGGDNISKSAGPADMAVAYKVVCNNRELRPEELPAQMAAATGKLVLPFEMELIFEDGRRLNMLIGAVPLLAADGRVRGAVAFGTDITDRKKAEEALRESEERYRKLVDTATEGIWIFDTQAKTTFVNQRTTEMLGYSQEEMLGKTPYEFMDEKDKAAAKSNTDQRLKGIPGRNERKYVRKDGSIIWVIASSTPLLDNNKVIAIMGMITDITESKKAEEALKESEHRYRSLFENMIDGYAYCQAVFEDSQLQDFSYIDVNKSFEQLTGLTDVTGKRVTNVIPGIKESSPELFEIYGRVALSGQPEKFEMYLDPLQIWFSVSVYSIEQGTFTAVFENITERKKAEESLKESEARFRSVLDNSRDFIYRANLQTGCFEYVSPSVKKVLGFTPDEYKSLDLRTTLSTVHPDDMERVQKAAKRLEETGSGEIEYRVRNKRGEYPWVSNHLTVIKDDSGQPLFRDGIVRDITEAKKAEEALRESEERLKRSQEIAHLGSWELDLINDRLSWSDEVYRIFGLKPQEFGATYEAFLEAVHPDDRAAVDVAYSGSVREGKDFYEIEHRVVRKYSGEIRYVYEKCTHVRDTSGKIIRSIGMVHDITDRKRAEEQLSQRAEELETVMNLVPVAIWVAHDPECNNITGNRTANEFYEAKEGENVSAGPGPGEPIPPRRFFRNGKELTAEELPMQEAAARNVDIQGSEFNVILPSGKSRALWGSASPLRDDDGQVRGVVAAFLDITERKQAEEDLKHYTVELESANKELEAFSYSVSHDLRSSAEKLGWFQPGCYR